MGRILVVDDEPNMRRILASNLTMDGHSVDSAEGVTSATALLSDREYDTVITDQKMPDGDGLRVLSTAHENDPSVSVIFLTAVATIELAVESMRQGAFDFITKPFTPGVIRATVRRACERTQLVRENAILRNRVGQLAGADSLFGLGPSISDVREKISRVAMTDATVLITGETGTGKELVARAIHRNSRRAAKPLIAVNCAAFTETLLESELFGHERGAFTGADKARQGLFEAAHESTLFLDEAGEMSAAAQAKLLRVLVDGQVQRVGTTRERKVDVRVLVATHRNLQERVKQGRFREDLYYRLAVFPIHLPPLRERREDVPGLCELLSAQIARDLKVQALPLTSRALEKLMSYPFPGNIRELRNLLERAHILGHGSVIEDLPTALDIVDASSKVLDAASWVSTLPDNLDMREMLADVERSLMERALERTHGVQAEAARMLNLSRSDFGYKATKHSLVH